MQPKQIALLSRKLIEEKQGEHPVILDVADQTTVAHYFVITHGNSAPHVKAIVDYLMETFKAKKVKIYHVEGVQSAEWVLLDVGPVIIHVFHRDKRDFYNLERLWGDDKEIT